MVRQTVIAPARAAAAYREMVATLSHPQSGPLTVASTNDATVMSSEIEDSASGSRAPGAARCWGTTGSVDATTNAPIGTLSTKIHRQLDATSRPPTVGPRVPATAASPAQSPTTRLCWREGKACKSNPSEVGTMTAAPTACAMRPPTRIGSVGARAHTTDATVKTTVPTSRKRRRPKWSASRPAGISNAANTTV
jgi:hypothetical protein